MLHLFSAGDEWFTVAKMVTHLLELIGTIDSVTSLGKKLSQEMKL